MSDIVETANSWDRCYPGNVDVQGLVAEMAATITALRAELFDLRCRAGCGPDQEGSDVWQQLEALRAENEASWQREQRLARNVAELKAEVERLREALERAEFWFKARLTGNAVGGSTSERLEDIRAALAEKGE